MELVLLMSFFFPLDFSRESFRLGRDLHDVQHDFDMGDGRFEWGQRFTPEYQIKQQETSCSQMLNFLLRGGNSLDALWDFSPRDDADMT